MKPNDTEPMNATIAVRSRRWSIPVVAAITAITIVSVSLPARAVDEPTEPVPTTSPATVTTTSDPPAPETTTPDPTTTTPTTGGPPTTLTTGGPTTTAPVETEPAETSTTTPQITAPATTLPAAAPQNVQVLPSQIANILATIRYVESRGNYGAPPNKGGASGAYQFIASTWDGYGGYSQAYLAPPEDPGRACGTWTSTASSPSGTTTSR